MQTSPPASSIDSGSTQRPASAQWFSSFARNANTASGEAATTRVDSMCAIATRASATGEAPRALLHERARALGEIVGRGEALLSVALGCERLLERRLRGGVDHRLGECDGHWRGGQQLVTQGLSRRFELVRRRDAVREADCQRLLGPEEAPGHDQLLRASDA